MLINLTITFLISAIICALLGFGAIAAIAGMIANLFFFLFLIAFFATQFLKRKDPV